MQENIKQKYAILAAYGLPKFEKNVEDFANSLDTSITKEEINKRRDMRNILTFTIDQKMQKILMMLCLFKF